MSQPALRVPLRTLRLCTTALTLVLCALAPSSAGAQATPPHFDLLIRGGDLIDGTGNPAYRTDVGVREGRIVAVGLLPDATADRVVEAQGLVVTPGFIDIHSHADDTNRGGGPIRRDDPQLRAAPNLVSQGITTVVVNQDGRSPWPISEQRAEIQAGGVGVNVLLMVGHGAIRGIAMGDDVRREATEEEIAEMRRLLRQGLEEGAWGLSAGLEYAPGRWSTTAEVAEVAKELHPFDGVYISHERSEGSDPMWYWPSQDPPGAPTLLDAVMETIEIGRVSGAKVVASHIKAKGAHYWGSSAAAIQLIERAREEGVRVWADQYPYPTSGTDGSTVLIPDWALDRDRGETRADALRATLADPEDAAALRRDIAHEIRRRGGPDRVVIFEYPDEALVGKSVAEVAAEKGVDPVEAAILLQLEGDPERSGGGRMRGFSMSELDVEAYAARPWVATTTDGGVTLPSSRSVHPRFYGTFPRKIGYYARDRGVLSVEDAVRSATSLPAIIMGLEDRGLVRPGMRADLVVLDLDRLEDRTTFFEPHAYPAGIEHVFVNGEAAVTEGERTWALAGEVIPNPRSGR